MYDNILVPISFDEDRDAEGSLAVARALSNAGGKITLLHVMEQIPGYAISYMPTDYITESRAAIQTELTAMAEGVRAAALLSVGPICLSLSLTRPLSLTRTTHPTLYIPTACGAASRCTARCARRATPWSTPTSATWWT